MSQLLNGIFALTLIFALVKLIRLFIHGKKAEYLLFLIASLAYLGVISAEWIDTVIENSGYIFNHELMVEWSGITGVAFVLSGLAFLIYHSKPPFARFPILLCFIPLLIIPAYFFSIQTIILKVWIMILYESGALLIAFLMYLALLKKSLQYSIALLGVIIISSGYVLFRYETETLIHSDWVWKSFLISGTFILIHGFDKIEYDETEESISSNPTYL